MDRKDLISYLNRIYKYLEIYGIDKYNLRENLLLSFMISELIDENQNTGLLSKIFSFFLVLVYIDIRYMSIYKNYFFIFYIQI